MPTRIFIPVLLALLMWPTTGIKGDQMATKSASSGGVQKQRFGTTDDGTPVDMYILSNGHGMTVRVINYGATITSIEVPDKSGNPGDVILGFDNVKQYLAGHPYFGSTVGRVANRIAHGRFKLNGLEYQLATNNGPNHLHGGVKGYSWVVWKGEAAGTPGTPAAKFTYSSHDGEEGYPGAVTVSVTFSVTPANELKIEYTATGAIKPTPLNLTNHAYFNLAGPGRGDILAHVLKIEADKYTPTDETLIPTGQIVPVKGTPVDFTSPTPVGARIAQVKGGYDLNYVLNSGGSKTPVLAARVKEPGSGRVMEVLTTEPGIQFYTGNFLDGTLKGVGGTYKKHYALCLETQHFPDAVNHPDFAALILKPGETFSSVTVYRFLTE